jgi:hypothetical protein
MTQNLHIMEAASFGCVKKKAHAKPQTTEYFPSAPFVSAIS